MHDRGLVWRKRFLLREMQTDLQCRVSASCRLCGFVDGAFVISADSDTPILFQDRYEGCGPVGESNLFDNTFEICVHFPPGDPQHPFLSSMV